MSDLVADQQTQTNIEDKARKMKKKKQEHEDQGEEGEGYEELTRVKSPTDHE